MVLQVGLLVGRERSFPDALIAEVDRRNAGVVASYAEIDATSIDRPPPYDVIVDRISHEVTCYQPVLKLACLAGTRVVNNPFWRIADDKRPRRLYQVDSLPTTPSGKVSRRRLRHAVAARS